MNERKRADIERIKSECSDFWRRGESIPAEILKQVSSLGIPIADILELSPFFPIFKLTESVSAGYSNLQSSLYSLFRDFGALYSEARYGGSTPSDLLTFQAQASLALFLFSAGSLVDTYRTLRKQDQDFDDAYEDLFKASFQDKLLVKFVQDLRNCFGHASFVDPKWSMSSTIGQPELASAVMYFDARDLKSAYKKWTAEAKLFMEMHPKIDITHVAATYFAMAKRFFQSYQTRSGILFSPLYSELRRVHGYLTTSLLARNTELLLQIIPAGSSAAFEHIADHFTAEELHRILALPMRSKKQVDYMILLRDPLGTCDVDLRKRLYGAFDVTDTT